jgi:hypothetical protein
MDLIPTIKTAPSIKPLINIGALMDIPTGTYLLGKHGEMILNGGLGAITGVVGIGNNFKSTILHYMNLSALSRITCQFQTSLQTYDTEINIHEGALIRFTRRFKEFASRNLFQTGEWKITDRTIYSGNKWWEELKSWLELKNKSRAKIEVTTPFVDRDGITNFKMIAPTFGQLDSLSEWQTDDVSKMIDENEIGESGGNTMHMRQGLAKTRLLMELPVECANGNHYLSITAQVGKEIQMASGPMPAPPVKKLQHLKNGDKLKGVSDKFFFLMSNCWQAMNAAPYINQGTKGPEYPLEGDTDNVKLNTDLNIVKLLQLRSKSGLTGIILEVLVSQSEGVLPSLTEFHYLKENNRFGISGTLQHYALDLLPDVKLSRTSVRTKIDENEQLQRALNISAEMLQMQQYWPNLSDRYICTPKQLYDDLTEMGYDWNTLLNTRGWWTIDNENHPVPYLSTMDLLRMRTGEYTPYWLLAEDKAKIKVKE